MAAGVTYEIDLTNPFGQRIQDLKFKGQPLAPTQKLRVVTNNYRVNCGGNVSVERRSAGGDYRLGREAQDHSYPQRIFFLRLTRVSHFLRRQMGLFAFVGAKLYAGEFPKGSYCVHLQLIDCGTVEQNFKGTIRQRRVPSLLG